jgi:hypothetical protein
MQQPGGPMAAGGPGPYPQQPGGPPMMGGQPVGPQYGQPPPSHMAGPPQQQGAFQPMQHQPEPSYDPDEEEDKNGVRLSWNVWLVLRSLPNFVDYR